MHGGPVPGEVYGDTKGGTEGGIAESSNEDDGFFRAVASHSGGLLVEVPDEKFNQKLKFAGRRQGKDAREEKGGEEEGGEMTEHEPSYEFVNDRRFERIPLSMASLPEFSEAERVLRTSTRPTLNLPLLLLLLLHLLLLLLRASVIAFTLKVPSKSCGHVRSRFEVCSQ